MNETLLNELIEKYPNAIFPDLEYIDASFYENEELYACMYDTTSYFPRVRNHQPKLGKIVKEEDRRHNENFYFKPYNENGDLDDDRKVLFQNRIYTYSIEESKSIFNDLVNYYIEHLSTLLEQAKNDLL